MDPAVQLPVCHQCGVDDFLIFESFTPAAGETPATANYTCSVCESFAGHNVPTGWSPPRWDK